MISVLVAVLAAASDPAVTGAASRLSAQADLGAVSLVLERGAGTESCPGEEDLRAAVAERLGFDPFSQGAAREIRCTVRRSEGAFRARIEVVALGAAATGGRDLISHRGDCQELAEAVALTIVIAINPLIAARPPPAMTVAPTPEPVAAPAGAEPPRPPATIPPPPAAPPPAVSTVARPAAAPQRAPSYELRFGADVALAVGLGPSAAPAVGLDGQVRRRALSLDVGARLFGQSSVTAGMGSAAVSLWSASVGACIHRGVLAACAVGSAGQFSAKGSGFATVRDSIAPYLAVGGRGVAEIPIGDRLRLRWTVEVAAPLVTVHVTVDDNDVWTSPSLNALSSLGLGLVFP